MTKTASGAKNTIIPNNVTENDFTLDINGRTKVGAPEGVSEAYIFNTILESIILIKPDSISGIKDLPRLCQGLRFV